MQFVFCYGSLLLLTSGSLVRYRSQASNEAEASGWTDGVAVMLLY